MKKLSVLTSSATVILLLVTSLWPSLVFAQSYSNEYYILNDWHSEGSGYIIRRSVTLKTVVSPKDLTEAKSCTLKKGQVFDPYEGNTYAVYVTRSGVDRYRTTRSSIGHIYGSRQYEKGIEVIQLADLGEAVCKVLVQGQTQEDDCPGIRSDMELIQESQVPDQKLLNTYCQEGYSAWILVSDLEKHVFTLSNGKNIGAVKREALF